MLEVKNITKKYGITTILDDISFVLPQQQITAIIGSNGSGKSTLISIMARILSKDDGQVLLDKKELHEWEENRLAKTLSILKQSNTLNVKLTVNDLVGFGRFPYSKGKLNHKDREKITQALNYAKIPHLRHRYIDELSGGQRQMAYIAMIIAQDTPYIFLDEPLNNLDMKHSVELMNILRSLTQNDKKTIIIVIHDINFVSVYADYIIALKNQKISFKGEKNEGIDDNVLYEIFDMDMKVREIDDKKVCIYY